MKRKVPLFETEPIVTVCEETEIDKEKNGGKKNGERRGKEKGGRSLGEGEFGGVLLFFSELHRRYQRKDSVSGGLVRYYRSTLKYPRCTPYAVLLVPCQPRDRAIWGR